MDNFAVWSALGFALVSSLAYLTSKGFSLIRVHMWNQARLLELKKRGDDPQTPPEDKLSANLVTEFCNRLQAKWILGEADFQFLQNTRTLVIGIARTYHPEVAVPLAEARLGRLLKAFLGLKDQLASLAQTKGLHKLTQFRMRHVVFISQAWQQKQKWELSTAGTFLKKYPVYFLIRWFYFLIRCMDLSFWVMKMLIYLIYDVIFKVLLIRWYLVVGELAVTVYQDRDPGPGIQEEKIIEDFETLPNPDDLNTIGLPEGIKRIVDTSRKDILFNPWALGWDETRDLYGRLVEDIARYYYPLAQQPLHEIRLFNLITASARFAETLSSLQNYPLLNKAMDLRISHILWIKYAAEIFQDNQLLAWLKKYQIPQVVKYSSLIFKVIKRKHPGLLFKDFAFSLAKEGGKRWVYLYCHEKLAAEANAAYRKE